MKLLSKVFFLFVLLVSIKFLDAQEIVPIKATAEQSITDTFSSINQWFVGWPGYGRVYFNSNVWNDNHEKRLNMRFDVNTATSVDSAFLHFFVSDAVVDTNFDFMIAPNLVYNASSQSFTANNFDPNIHSAIFGAPLLVDDRNGNLGTGVSKNSVFNYSNFDTEYVIDITQIYLKAQAAIQANNPLSLIGFTFFLKPKTAASPYTSSYVSDSMNIAVRDLTHPYASYPYNAVLVEPYIELYASEPVAVPEPFSIMLLGSALISLGIRKKIKK